MLGHGGHQARTKNWPPQTLKANTVGVHTAGHLCFLGCTPLHKKKTTVAPPSGAWRQGTPGTHKELATTDLVGKESFFPRSGVQALSVRAKVKKNGGKHCQQGNFGMHTAPHFFS